MTREEQIRNEAIDFSEYEDNFLEYDDCGDVCDDKSFIENAFISGAKWADEHPANEQQSLNVKEILYVAQKTTAITKKEIIIKACEYLKANMQIPENVGNWYIESFLQQFRKAMEE